MNNFLNKNPQSPEIVLGPTSVPLNRTYGTNFSSFSIGGFKEVFSVDELYYNVPNNTFGQINYSGNSIPITFFKGSGTSFSFDTIILNSDNISSGRRKLGMLAYVYEENKIYQFNIDNYETLFNNALISSGIGGPTVTISKFGTTVKGNSPAGIAFISAWTSNIVEGISGGTESNSVWKKLIVDTPAYTGGTITGATIFTDGLTANTISAATYLNLPSDIYVTGFTYLNNVLTIERSVGQPNLVVTINEMTGLTINGNLVVTGNTLFDELDIIGDFNLNGNQFITGNTNQIGNFNLTGDTSLNGNLIVTGNTILNNLTATTISASTYQNLPIDPDTYTTGFSYNNNTFTIEDNSGNTFNATINNVTGLTINGGLNVTGDTIFNGLTATTISAGTYQNLPLDVFVTGVTYNDNTFTYTNNSGGTFDVLFNILTGLTINGNLTVTGTTNLSGLTLYDENVLGTNPIEIVNVDYLTGYVETFDVYVTGTTYTEATDSSNYTEWELLYHSTPIGNPPYTFSGQNTYTTGGTYDNNTALITFLRNDGKTGYTIDLSTLDLNDTYVTGGTSTGSTTFSPNATIDLTYSQDVLPNTYSLQYKDVYTTGFTYSDNTFTIKDNSGNTYSANISLVTGLTINGDLNVIGDVFHTGNTIQIGDVELIGNTFITGDTSQEGDVTLSGNTFIIGSTNQEGDITISGNTFITGNTSQVGDIILNGDTFITGNTSQEGDIVLSGNTQQIGNFHITGDTSQIGNITLSGDTFITGNTIQIGDVTLNGNTSQEGDITLSGNTFITGNTSQVGNIILNGDTFITGNTLQVGNFHITGNTSQEGDVTLSGSTFITGNTQQVGDVNLVGNTFITGNTNQIGDFYLIGNSIIQSGVTASSYNISTIPISNDTLFQILGRNEITGEVEYRQVNTIGNNVTIITGGTYSAQTTIDNVIGVDTSLLSSTIYLPDSISSGRLRFEIKDIGLNAYNNPITIIASGTDTIISYTNSQTLILESEGGAIILFNTGIGQWWQM